MPRKSTQEEVIDKFKKTHGDRYGYSKVKYKNSCTKVIITCKTHGDFEQVPKDHMRGRGCSKCGDILKSESKKKSLLTVLTS